MSERFHDVQRVVLMGGPVKGRPWATAQHLMLDFGARSKAQHFLWRLRHGGWWPDRAQKCTTPQVQGSVGFSRRGLERACLPSYPLALLAAKAPAFSAGAAVRGPVHAGAHGRNAPMHWDELFAFEKVDAVLSLHAEEAQALDRVLQQVEDIAYRCDVTVRRLPRAQWRYDRSNFPQVHFDYRDNLSAVGIEGWTSDAAWRRLKEVSRHAAGEFLLGHAQNSGANPWLASGTQTWPEGLRKFFHNGSFGVLHVVEQDVIAFDRFVADTVKAHPRLDVETLRAKLCGRTSDGRPAGSASGVDPTADHDYAEDEDGTGCPYGAHTRRMNPRAHTPRAHTRPRPLLRRGMPYTESTTSLGLIGLFFCASIEDQFEHLLGQWGDRAPLGDDPGGARDPLIGAHQPGDGPFVIPMGKDVAPIELPDMPPFARTRGTAYLFFPSLTALDQIAQGKVFPFSEKDQDR